MGVILRLTTLVVAVALVFALASSTSVAPDAGELLAGKVARVDLAPAPLVSEAPVLAANGHMWGDWDGWGWIVMMPMMLIFWGGLIWLVVWLVRRSPDNTGTRDNDPIEIARRRYARGEISSEELEQIRRNLSA